jgi:phage terminase large subunit-like protein
MTTATKTRRSRTSAEQGASPRPPSAATDPATRYAHDVVAGRVLAGRLVRLACERHLRDLERDDLAWDRKLAGRAIGFFRDVLRLNGGEHEGKPFILEPFQCFIVGSLFGWLAADGTRRFRVGFVEIAKGNGKTPLAAGIGHYMAWADKEPRAEVYAAATKKDQAMILFRDAVAMAEQSPALSKRLKTSGSQPNVWNLADLETGSFFRPIASDDAQSGPRPHCGLIDEVHEHKSPIMIDMMRAGTKGRRQALILEITNSGYDPLSVCGQHHEYSEKVLTAVLVDDSWFAFICGLDACEACRAGGKGKPSDGCPDCDDWRDERVWPKANPNLGVSVTVKYLREQVREAIGMPAKQNVVRRLNFCEWTEQNERWLDMSLWDSGAEAFDIDALRGRVCYAGLDLAKVNDLSALALVFPPAVPGEKWKALLRFWVPKDDMVTRSKRDRVPYDQWVREGYIVATDGNATDFGFIEAEVLELCGLYDLRELAYDRVFAGEIVQNLMGEGVTVVPFGQGFLSMGSPTAEIHRMLLAGEFQHAGNPVLRWNASNVTVATDAAGNIKPDKERSTERIDGVVAVIMAIGRAKVQPANEHSVYNDEELLVL